MPKWNYSIDFDQNSMGIQRKIRESPIGTYWIGNDRFADVQLGHAAPTAQSPFTAPFLTFSNGLY
jgi:hypothetical protein